MHYLKIFLTSFVSVFVYHFVPAQQSTTMISPSPDAAALGVYGNIPVSTYTGIPSIKVPLHSIEYRDIQIPVELSYYASGITVEQDASWVGLGWSLNVGGVITRTVKGGDDMQFATDGFSNVTNFDYQGYPYDDDDSSVDFPRRICIREIDPEPDMFNFNFWGKSGEFVLENGQDRLLDFVKGTPLKVEKIDIQYDKVNDRWQIKTSDGFIYYFGTIERTEIAHGTTSYGKGPETMKFDSETQGFLSYDDIVVTAWYLDKVVSPLGEEVDYVYDVTNGSLTNSPYLSARITISDTKQTVLNSWAVGECYPMGAGGAACKIFTNHIYLKEINYALGKVIFKKSLRDDMIPISVNASNPRYLQHNPYWMDSYNKIGPQRLDSIMVLNKAGKTLKRFELGYDYFNSQVTGNDKYSFKRLKLDKVRECSGQECKPYHQFVYEESHPLPSKYSTAQDFWGYYNGANDNISRVPYGTYYLYSDEVGNPRYYYPGDSDRQPNAVYMTAGILKKIIYPTGGSSEFEFEPHDYYNFGDDAFKYTDFTNNEPIPVTQLHTTELDPTYKTITFTLSDPLQDVVIEGMVNYYHYTGSSLPCNVTFPSGTIVGTEIWYSLRPTSSSTDVVTHRMSDFLDFFMDNYNDHCATQPPTPEEIDPIYHNTTNIALPAGTYELKVYAFDDFNIDVIVSRKIVPPRVIPQKANGVYAKIAGGLRIAKIITKDDPAATPQIKKYDYTLTVTGGEKRSTGRLMLFPEYHVPFYCTYSYQTQSTPIALKSTSWSNTPLATSAEGSIVGYDRVTEWQGGNHENGSIEYNYRNQEDEPLYSMLLIEGLPSRPVPGNGLLLEVKEFDRDGNTLRTENYLYNRQLEKDFKGFTTKKLVILDGMTGAVSEGCYNNSWLILHEYYVVSDRWVPSQKTERVYLQNSTSNYIETVTNFTYDVSAHLQLTSERSTSSTGESFETLYSYPPDASWIPTAMWQDKFIYDKIVQKRIFRNNNLKDAYQAFYSSQANTFLLNEERSAAGSAALETTNSYSHSTEGNVLQVVGRDGTPHTYLWGYNNNYPIAHIQNATLTQVLAAMGSISEASLSSFSDADTPSFTYLTKISGLKTNLPDAQVSTFSYEPLVGIKKITDPNGKTISYEYDRWGRLITVKDHDGNILKTHSYNYKQ